MIEALKKAVFEANIEIARRGLVLYTWGNVSAVDRDQGLIVIKPSGVAFEELTPDDMAVVDLEGKPAGGRLKPSSDTPTHAVLYRAFPSVGAIVHTHSHYATAWAQARRPIPCLGTTHADQFRGEVPVTGILTEAETAEDYESNTGRLIVRRFEGLDPLERQAVLVAGHGPFTWGMSVEKAVENAVVLEEVARLALHTLALAPGREALEDYLLEKHFLRKHGAGAYYGQE